MTSLPIRFSWLRAMGRSPAHALYAMTHEMPDTAGMRLGRLAHSIMLGRNVPTVFEGARRGKVWTDFKSEHLGEDIVTESEFEQAGAIASALHSHREARHLLLGAREQTVTFDFAGRACRATPDAFTADRLTELKTTNDASPQRFPYIASRLAYGAQMSWYKDALKKAELGDPEQLSIVAIETKPPFAVCVFGVTPRAEDFGRRLYQTWLQEFLVCEESNQWPGYPMGVLDAPEDALELVGADGETFELTD